MNGIRMSRCGPIHRNDGKRVKVFEAFTCFLTQKAFFNLLTKYILTFFRHLLQTWLLPEKNSLLCERSLHK